MRSTDLNGFTVVADPRGTNYSCQRVGREHLDARQSGGLSWIALEGAPPDLRSLVFASGLAARFLVRWGRSYRRGPRVKHS